MARYKPSYVMLRHRQDRLDAQRQKKQEALNAHQAKTCRWSFSRLERQINYGKAGSTPFLVGRVFCLLSFEASGYLRCTINFVEPDATKVVELDRVLTKQTLEAGDNDLAGLSKILVGSIRKMRPREDFIPLAGVIKAALDDAQTAIAVLELTGEGDINAKQHRVRRDARVDAIRPTIRGAVERLAEVDSSVRLLNTGTIIGVVGELSETEDETAEDKVGLKVFLRSISGAWKA